MRTCGVLAGLAGAMLTLAGCGGGTSKVDISGTVTYDTAAVADGEITFIPDDKAVGPEAARIKDGKYAAAVRAGKHRVEIRAYRAVPGKKGPMGTEDLLEPYIPKKYNDQTTLTAEVASGKTTHDYNLEK